MLSDEEKKEYEEAKLYLTHTGLDDFNLEKHQSENRVWAIKTLLNLIEKQQKEIEELKENILIHQEYNKGYFQGRRDERDETDDHIKAKIEEYKKEQEFYNKNEDREWGQFNNWDWIDRIINEMQSLLEKE